MGAKEIAIVIVFCVFLLPLLIQILVWSFTMGDKTLDENTDVVADLIEKAAVPWWVGVLDGLSKLGTFGALLIIGFVIFLKWIGEVD